MSDRQLKPWQRVPDASCERCDSQATYRVIVDPDADGTLNDEAREVGLGLVCSDHITELSAAVVEHADTPFGIYFEPLRDTWWHWFTGTRVGWLFGYIEAELHEWWYVSRRLESPLD
jgi:hypothetical protein